MKWRVERALVVATGLAVAACASTPHLSNRPAPGASSERRDYPMKVGAPYQVGGIWYYPSDDRDYDEIGVASWYGPGFNGKSTANGEVYDQEMLSAAHKTLPLPSYVEVTNLETGRSLVVRVNDRGPFVSTRVIDLSRKSAEVLGVQRAGTARVRVRRVFPRDEVMLALRRGVTPPVALADASTAPTPPLPARAAAIPGPPPVWVSDTPSALPPIPTPMADAVTRAIAPTAAQVVRTVTLPPSSVVASMPPAPVTASPSAPSYIQVAALADRGRAEWLKGYLSAFGAAGIQPNGSGLYRVRLGPFTDAAAIASALARVRASGYQDAHVVTGFAGAPASP